jgi:hypothetical protein
MNARLQASNIGDPVKMPVHNAIASSRAGSYVPTAKALIPKPESVFSQAPNPENPVFLPARSFFQNTFSPKSLDSIPTGRYCLKSAGQPL